MNSKFLGTGVALVTPFKPDLSIDHEALVNIVNFNIENGIDYLVINGTTGETDVVNVFDNDTLNGSAVDPADVTLTETIPDPNGYLTLNPDGSVDVAAGTPAG